MRPFVSLAVVLLLAACGTPPELRQRGGPLPTPSATEPSETPPYPPGFTPRQSPSRSPSPSPSPSPFPEYTTAPCAGRVKAEDVISAVKANTSINPSKALTGPLCAGTWQYTVVEVSGNDPVQVVTRDNAKFVVAGTEVCTAEVRLYAPSGIKSIAGC